ncbi:MAG TPA: hypothetical protein VE136_05135 [Anaerolineales bacterium]|jgi:hypothetical protein|nr:hypothetical protein [Anaerolineales bacterium]
MEIITNERLVRRNARIGQATSIVGLLVLAGGMYISFTQPQLFGLSLAALLVGFALSQIGIYFGNRWSRRPRPDEILSQALKGLDDRYALYHYSTPAAHLLVGPAGVWVLLPRHQRGTITYEEAKGRWRQKGGNLYLKIFAQEGLGRPDLEISSEIDVAQRYLGKILPEDEVPEVQAALVFTNERAEVEAENASAATLHVKKLKDFIRKTAKSKPISMDTVKEIHEEIG